MDVITETSVEPLKDSQFVKPFRMRFKQNGKPRLWDLVMLHDNVCIIIFNVQRKKLLFVKQFRPAAYLNSFPKKNFLVDETKCNTVSYPGSEGVTLELCAGIVDKTSDEAVTAQTEVLEECGYNVPIDKFERIISWRSVGVSVSKQTAFYVEVDDSMKVSEGGGMESEGEMIDVVEMSIEEVKAMLKKPHLNSPAGFLFGLTWFMQHKAPLYS